MGWCGERKELKDQMCPTQKCLEIGPCMDVHHGSATLQLCDLSHASSCPHCAHWYFESLGSGAVATPFPSKHQRFGVDAVECVRLCTHTDSESSTLGTFLAVVWKPCMLKPSFTISLLHFAKSQGILFATHCLIVVTLSTIKVLLRKKRLWSPLTTLGNPSKCLC